MLDRGVAAILFNCSQPEVMAGAIAAARAVRDARGSKAKIGVYANAFPPQRDEAANDGLSDIRADLTPDRYAGSPRTGPTAAPKSSAAAAASARNTPRP